MLLKTQWVKRFMNGSAVSNVPGCRVRIPWFCSSIVFYALPSCELHSPTKWGLDFACWAHVGHQILIWSKSDLTSIHRYHQNLYVRYMHQPSHSSWFSHKSSFSILLPDPVVYLWEKLRDMTVLKLVSLDEIRDSWEHDEAASEMQAGALIFILHHEYH